MITLKTLDKATAQEVFDQAARHLLNQGKRATWGGACAYRAPDGGKCAVGCFIADDEYDISFEGKCAIHLPISCHLDLLRKLQIIHDGVHPEYWESELKTLAERLNLKFNP